MYPVTRVKNTALKLGHNTIESAVGVNLLIGTVLA